MENYATNVGKHLSSDQVTVRHDVVVTNHYFTLPLSYALPDGEHIKVFARELVSTNNKNSNAPWLLYLQGGPGFGSPRPEIPSGWVQEALKNYRILLLDQRGTGLSTPVTAALTESGTPQEQAQHLTHFRADNIVRDAEAIRQLLNIECWYTLGQSFGGFCTLTYLSLAPEALAGSVITGGLPGLENSAKDVYHLTYPRMATRWQEYLSWYPEDQLRLNAVADKVREGGVLLPSGEELSVPRLQQLGMYLGGNARVDQLHYLLEEAFLPNGELSPSFLEKVFAHISFAANPLYAVMHESIYGQNQATGWAADKLRTEYPGFVSSAADTLPTGEHIIKQFFDVDPALIPFKEVADLLAHKDDWPSLYDADRLADNSVPVAAAVYGDDVYVPSELSLQTAQKVKGLQVWYTEDYHHDGLRADGASIFQRLAGMAAMPGYA